MGKILNLTQHEATSDQKKAGVREVVSKARVRQLLTFEELPSKKELRYRARELAWIAEAYNAECDRVMIGGAPYLMPFLERALKRVGMKPVYAFSKRECIEEKMTDGSVRKMQVFRHIGFVEV